MVTEKMNQTQLSILQRANLPKHFQVYERRGPRDRVRRREAVGARGSPKKLLKQQTTHKKSQAPRAQPSVHAQSFRHVSMKRLSEQPVACDSCIIETARPRKDRLLFAWRTNARAFYQVAQPKSIRPAVTS